MMDLVLRPEEITLDWLNQALRESGVLDASPVAHFNFELIGTGKMGDNARFNLHYEGEQGSAPSSVIGKFAAADETARSMASAGGAYYNEVMFYREFAPKTRMSTPRIFAAEVSEAKTEFVLLMEDMAPAQPGSNLVSASQQQTELVLQEAAKLAAAFYGSPDLVNCDHLMGGGVDDGGEFGAALMQQSWPAFVDRFGEYLSAESIAMGEYYVERHTRFVTLYQGPKTLVHGDLRSENVLLGDNSATVVDWQTPAAASPLTDTAYFLGGSVSPEDRKAWETHMLASYREWLAEAGVQLSFDECWEQYRQQSMHGILITVLGATFSEPAERSDRMFTAMIRGHLQHCIDLEAKEFLD